MGGPFVRTIDQRLAARAAVFGALGEPVRLAIIESLLLSDLTPQDVVETLGIRSNLLAHHLNVLESAGLIQRVRGEGDGRRRYLRLMDALPDILSLTPGKMDASEVVFICHEDKGLSQIALQLWRRRSQIPVRAAAHKAARVSVLAARVAVEMDLEPLQPTVPRVVDIEPTDGVVVTLSDIARERARLPVAGPTPTLHWSMPRWDDPMGLARAVTDLNRRMDVLATALAA